MKTAAVLLMACALAASAAAQPEEEILWTRTYGGQSADAAEWIEPVEDAGFVFCGTNCSGSENGCQIWLVRINNDGDMEWQRSYGGYAYEYGESMAKKADGGYVLTGPTESYGAGGQDFYLVSTDASGNPLWTRTFGGDETDRPYVVRQCADGGFMLAGYTTSFGNGGQDMYLVKTNASGEMQWSRTFGGSQDDLAYYAIQTEDGGYILAGLTYSFGAGERDVYVVKTDAEGNPVWTRTYGGADIDFGESIKQTRDGGYIVCGATKSFGPDWHNAYLIRISSDGNVIWQQAYGGPYPDHAMDVVECPDGGYFVAAGYRPSLTAPYEGWLFKVNESGEMLWQQTVGGIADDWPLNCHLTPEGGYIVAGTTHSFGAGSEDAWLIRVGGESGSEGTDVSGTVSGVWDIAGSPYRVLGDITVPTDHTLTITPGVQVLFTGHYKFNIYGTVIAEGTEQDSIVFTRAYPTEESKWWGLRIYEAGSNARFAYCVIEYGKATGDLYDRSGGGIMCLQSSPRFDHCTIRNNWAQHNGGGILCDSGTPRFNRCVITGNTGVYGGGVNCWHTSAVFTSCTISDNFGTAAGGALRIGESSASFENTIFAFSVGGPGMCFNDGSPYGEFHYCDFHGNSGGTFSGPTPAGLGVLNQTNVNGDPCDQFFNIFLDPLFADHAAADYHLTPLSACINAGNPASPHDPDGSIADIGAFHFGLPPGHHFVSVPPTGQPYAFVVDGATVDGQPLEPGDEIGVFDGLLCVGAAPVGEEWPLTVTAWAADIIHDLPGFLYGNPITYRVWSHELDVDVYADANYTVGDGLFGTGAYSRISLAAQAATEQHLPLLANYANLISLTVRPEEPSVEAVFGGIAGLQAVYDDNGHVFIPPDVNTFGELPLTEGYRVFCTAVEMLTVFGLPVNPMMEYPLRAGQWNWIGYPLDVCVPVEDALASIAPHLIIIQDDAGGAWIPGEGINTLGELVPGKGYMILVTQDCVLSYGAPPAQTQNRSRDVASVSLAGPPPTGLPYHVVVKLEDWPPNSRPSRIELYDGACGVGAAEVSTASDCVPVVAWQGVPELGLEGFTPGHAMEIVARDKAGRILPCRVTQGAPSFGSGGYGIVVLSTDENSAETPGLFSVGEGYPNPFNPAVTIPYTLPEAGAVTIRVFNSLGQTLWESVESQTAGEHRFTFDVSQLSNIPVSGLYFVRVEFAGRGQIRKLILLR
ncbi:MAG: T9SS type A sorting domain-containing protein [bacterium]|nr:T9SS type A sorting domain-containing protein [bacterium]